MRISKFTLITIAAFILTSCSYISKPNLVLSTHEIDFGNIDENEQGVAETKVYNKGNETLLIRAITTDCSCTQANIDNKTIAPNDSATIHIKFDSTGKDGMTENFVVIEANTDTVIHYIRVVSNVIPYD